MKRICLAAVSFLLVNGAFAQNDMAMRQMIQSNCMPDIKQFCADKKPGGGVIIACLNAHMTDLSSDCQNALNTINKQQ